MNNCWERFSKSENLLLDMISDKQIILWGYGPTGIFTEHLLKRHGRKITCIIDNDARLRFVFNISSSVILDKLNPANNVILLTFNPDDGLKKLLDNYGFNNKDNVIVVKDIFAMSENKRALGYFSWLEVFYGVNICGAKERRELNYSNSDWSEYGASSDFGIVDIFSRFDIKKGDAFFDFGFGKAGIFPLVNYLFPNVKIGGVEYDKDLYGIAKDNMTKLKINAEGLINGDAQEVNEALDEYNYIYMYNPFSGSTFRNVVKNIQKSYDRNPRKIVWIYSAPLCHSDIIRDEYFKLIDQVPINMWVRYVNVYETEARDKQNILFLETPRFV